VHETYFLLQILNKTLNFQLFKLNSAVQSCTAAAQCCTAAALVFFSYRYSAALQQLCSCFLALQRQHARSAEARSAVTQKSAHPWSAGSFGTRGVVWIHHHRVECSL
jgi:hypothetical protein